jgi:prevent-host-death family protein
MKSVNIHEAKTHLSRFVEEVAAGEELIIAKAGKPMARLVPIVSTERRRLGLLRGRIQVPDDFDEPMPEEVLALFQGNDAQHGENAPEEGR